MSILKFILIICFLFNITLQDENRKLLFVYESVRHGARGPSQAYSWNFKGEYDEFRVNWRGEGDGELTSVGKREHYDLGVRNRLKYGKGELGLGLIDFNTFDPRDILCHATDYNRTHQSLNSELIAMYQPGTLKELKKEELNISFPDAVSEWKNPSDRFKTLNEKILEEIEGLGNETIKDNIPVFNIRHFKDNRVFNCENTCKKIIEPIREKCVKENPKIFEYFLNKKDVLLPFFNESKDNDTILRDVRVMNSITDHYISDYKNGRDLSIFHSLTGINLDEFMDACGQFYHDWMYTYYAPYNLSQYEVSRIVEDLLAYMEIRMEYGEESAYGAPKLVIDTGHDTTVAPMQFFMQKAWEDYPQYNIKTKYCGFACNVYFELYLLTGTTAKNYEVEYYIDDKLIHTFPYDEFRTVMRKAIKPQDEVYKRCVELSPTTPTPSVTPIETPTPSVTPIETPTPTATPTQKENTITEEKIPKIMWVGFFAFIATTLIGIVGFLIVFIKYNKLKGLYLSSKYTELTTDLMRDNSETQQKNE